MLVTQSLCLDITLRGGQELVADAPSAPEEVEAMIPSPDAVAAEADPAPAPEHEPELLEAAPDAAAVAAPPAPEATAQARINFTLVS